MIRRLFLLTLTSLIAGPTVAGDLRVQGQLISETTSGPPLAVSSTEVVSNLNADRLDGFNVGDFAVEGSGVGVHYKNLVGVPGEEIDQDCAVNTGCFDGDDPGFPVTITVPGSYRLAGNLILSSAVNGISVEADNVSLDLAGFVIDGDGVGDRGIDILSRRNVEIRNGTVRNFVSVGLLGSGTGTSGHRAIKMRVESNGNTGIFLNGSGCHVEHSIASGNGVTTVGNGIEVGGGTVIHNVANDNSGRGILAQNATIAHNTASFNSLDGIRGVTSTMIGNTANENAGSGIECWFGLVKNSTVISNNTNDSGSEAGISVQGNCQVLQNNAQGNFQGNIMTTSAGSVFEENLVWNAGSGGCGLCLSGSGNFYANNRARGNTTDYDIATGNTDGGGNATY